MRIRFYAGTLDATLPSLLGKLFREVEGEHKGRYSWRKLRNNASGLQAIQLGHLEIKHDDVRSNLAVPIYRVLTISSFVTDAPAFMLLQNPTEMAPNRGVVVHDKNSGEPVPVR